MPEVSEPFSLPPLIKEKLRRLTLVLTPVGILTLLLSIWQNTQIKNATQVAHYGLPLLSIIFTLVWVLTLKNRISGRQATLAFTYPDLPAHLSGAAGALRDGPSLQVR